MRRSLPPGERGRRSLGPRRPAPVRALGPPGETSNRGATTSANRSGASRNTATTRGRSTFPATRIFSTSPTSVPWSVCQLSLTATPPRVSPWRSPSTARSHGLGSRWPGRARRPLLFQLRTDADRHHPSLVHQREPGVQAADDRRVALGADDVRRGQLLAVERGHPVSGEAEGDDHRAGDGRDGEDRSGERYRRADSSAYVVAGQPGRHVPADERRGEQAGEGREDRPPKQSDR